MTEEELEDLEELDELDGELGELDEEIENLYHQVAHQLSDNQEEATSALKKLSQAQDIIHETPDQYFKALDLVSEVKEKIVRKRGKRRRIQGLILFGLLLSILAIVGFIFLNS